MQLQQLYSYVRRAIDDYSLIEENDKIAIGLSGGKDSLTLLYALSGLKKFYPKKFDCIAISVDLGLDGYNAKPMQILCNQLGVEFHTIKTEIAPIIFDSRQESSPCSLCSKMRKGALNNLAKELGANKIAYGHHMDDIVETLLLSMLYEGRYHTFSPLTYLDRMELTLIRPMLYLPEANIIGFCNKYNITLPFDKLCPVDGNTKREYVKQLLKTINKDNPGAIKRIFNSIINSNLPGWSKKGNTIRE